MSKIICSLFITLFCFSCSSENVQPTPTPPETMYFPSKTGNVWETKSIAALGWKQSAAKPLLDYLELKHSKSFIIY